MQERQIENEEENAKEIEAKINQAKATIEEINNFKQSSLEALTKLYQTTDPKLIEECNKSFLNALAESNVSIVDFGRSFIAKMDEAFNDLLQKIPTGKFVDVNTRNMYTAILLSVFKPVEEFLKDDESRKEAFLHVNCINAALRVKKVRYNGCKAQWDAEDAALKELRKSK